MTFELPKEAIEKLFCKKLVLKQKGLSFEADNSVTVLPGDEIQVDIHFEDGGRGYSLLAVGQDMQFALKASDAQAVETLRKMHREANS